MFQNREAELIYEVTYDSAIRIAHLEQKSSWTYTALNIPLQKQSHLNEEKYEVLKISLHLYPWVYIFLISYCGEMRSAGSTACWSVRHVLN